MPGDEDFEYTLTEGIDFNIYGAEKEYYDVNIEVDLNNAKKFAYYDNETRKFEIDSEKLTSDDNGLYRTFVTTTLTER